MTIDLRNSIRANAIFSIATGALLSVAPATIGRWLGLDVDGWLRLLGLALLGHAAMLWWASRQPDIRRWAGLNLLAIAPYPLLMVALAIFGVVDTGAGRALVLADGLVVGGIAWAHWYGLRTSGATPVPTLS